MKKRESKIIVITGASSGIGKCTADMYRAKGETVINLSREKEVGYEEYSIVCDVSKEDMVQSAFKTIGEKYGKIDILINFRTYP